MCVVNNLFYRMFGLENRLNSMLSDPYTGVWIITLIGAFLMSVPMMLIGIEVDIITL